MTLYEAFLPVGPFILLAITAGAFGPWSKDDDEEWSLSFLWDVAMVISVIGGGIVPSVSSASVSSCRRRWVPNQPEPSRSWLKSPATRNGTPG